MECKLFYSAVNKTVDDDIRFVLFLHVNKHIDICTNNKIPSIAEFYILYRMNWCIT